MERPHRKLTAPWNDCPWEIATEIPVIPIPIAAIMVISSEQKFQKPPQPETFLNPDRAKP